MHTLSSIRLFIQVVLQMLKNSWNSIFWLFLRIKSRILLSFFRYRRSLANLQFSSLPYTTKHLESTLQYMPMTPAHTPAHTPVDLSRLYRPSPHHWSQHKHMISYIILNSLLLRILHSIAIEAFVNYNDFSWFWNLFLRIFTDNHN